MSAEQTEFDGNDFLSQVQAELIRRGYDTPEWPSDRDDAGPVWSAAEMIGGLLEQLQAAEDKAQYLEDAAVQCESADYYIEFLKDQREKLEAQCAAMRSYLDEIISYCRLHDADDEFSGQMLSDNVENAAEFALSSDAGRELAERLRKAEYEAEIERDRAWNIVKQRNKTEESGQRSTDPCHGELKEPDMNDSSEIILIAIEQAEKAMKQQAQNVLLLKNDYLARKGWTITSTLSSVAPYTYAKEGMFHMDADHAMEDELEGQT